MSSAIFSISGLRGVVNQGLTPKLIQYYCEAFSEFIKGKVIVIGRDNRPSSYYIAQDVYFIFSKLGYEIYDLGIAPTPMTVMMTRKLKADCGVEITASHNPENWNGLKFISNQGRFFFENELVEFKKIIKRKRLLKNQTTALTSDELVSVSKKFTLFNEKAVDEYLQTIISSRYFKDIKIRPLRIGIDCNNGSVEFVIQKLIKMLGGEVFSLNRLSYGFYRAPEPTPENLKVLSKLVRGKKLDLGIAFDPDGDRVAFVDDKAQPLSEEYTLLLAILFLFPQWYSPVVVNYATSAAVDELSVKFRFPVYRTKIGEANVVKKMEEIGALVGGEGNGGLILADINKARDGIIAALIVISLISREEKPLSEIRKMLPQYYIEKQIIHSYKKNWQILLKRKFGKIHEINLDILDGVKIISKDYWILVRKSNTEPVLRIIAESKSKKLTKKIINETINLIKR
ncbi:MAG: hypothetical protein NZ601_02915 [candidate division WOR-3 bacterium]|nr:hypothetical protein [candidate division WOR-3 bacterium]MCX7757001.1 hypothetical protein [candidate division WOR-3 bacterium]MDW7987838.1 hypothetical protein [candidate division WOR-3 bacterium]